MTSKNILVNLEHARKSFGDTEVLKDISLTVEEGEVLAIIGPSGGGKSTLLRCCTLLETLDGGSLSYADVAVTTRGLLQRHAPISGLSSRTSTCSRTTP